jgi:hypothetical protein
MPTVTVTYDVDPRLPDKGHSYMHCALCMRDKPDGITPQKWARQQLAVTKEGQLQLWCVRHDVNIALLEFDVTSDDDFSVANDDNAGVPASTDEGEPS